MRIVAGEFRGRRLAGPESRSTAVRPTADRVREAVFAILGDVVGARALDLFAGTGALALEALSRGAAHATLVDTDVRLALRNVARLGVEDRCEVVRADAITWLRGSRGSFDLIFCDPPYRLADRLEGDLAKLLPRRLSPGGRVIAESAARRPLELGMTPLDERAYGDTLVRFLAGGDAR